MTIEVSARVVLLAVADPKRAILRGRTEVRKVLRERPTTDAPLPISQLSAQVPIESDADAGFASRQRKQQSKAFKSSGLGSEPASLRRRRIERTRPPARSPQSPPREDTLDESPERFPFPQKSYATSLGDTFRHVRASSLSAFSGNLSPFRSRTSPPETSASPRRKSQRSITRWFGGGDSTSSDEDQPLHGSGQSEEDEHAAVNLTFGSDGAGGSAVADSDPEEIEVGEDFLSPIPPASGALSPNVANGAYSPPMQDME